jgi:hypothetical protein
MTDKEGKELIAVGACRFRDRAIAARVAQNKATFAAAVNREGMTDAEKADAFSAFFAPR